MVGTLPLWLLLAQSLCLDTQWLASSFSVYSHSFQATPICPNIDPKLQGVPVVLLLVLLMAALSGLLSQVPRVLLLLFSPHKLLGLGFRSGDAWLVMQCECAWEDLNFLNVAQQQTPTYWKKSAESLQQRQMSLNGIWSPLCRSVL